jgi:hypothetical protein
MSLRNLNPVTPIAEADIPATIARDSEIAAAIAAHLAAVDPHSQYGFRFRLASKSLPGPMSLTANLWNSLGTLPAFSWGAQGAPSLVGVGISFTFDTGFPWQQACCGGLLSPVWWQPATVADVGIRIPLESHTASGFFVNLRLGKLSGDQRDLQIFPESTISIPSSGRLDISAIKVL